MVKIKFKDGTERDDKIGEVKSDDDRCPEAKYYMALGMECPFKDNCPRDDKGEYPCCD